MRNTAFFGNKLSDLRAIDVFAIFVTHLKDILCLFAMLIHFSILILFEFKNVPLHQIYIYLMIRHN